MRILLRYLYSRRRIIAVILASVAVFSLFMVIYGVPASAVVYAGAICIVIASAAAFGDYWRYYKKYRTLKELQDEILITLEHLPSCDNDIERMYRELLETVFEEKTALRSEADAHYDNALVYFTMWAHQIKTPIAAMSLAISGSETPETAELSDGLQKIEQYVEMALYYIRLDNGADDFVFREYSLDKIIKQAVKRFSAQFIRKKIRLVYEPTEASVLTDEKWLLFVIEQVISNALKYTRSGSVEITVENTETPVLTVRDTGIGIAPEDLPRIFERGFTGKNGRADKKATGIGLYLCRRICKKLGAEISARSECDDPEKHGTEIRIGFDPRKPDTRD